MTLSLLSKMASVPWSIDQDALAVMLDIAQRLPVDDTALDAWKARAAPARDALATRADARLPGATRATLRDGVAVVPVSGPIFRYANLMTDMSGATSLATFASDLTLAGNDAKVRAIVLQIDSPGGEVTGMTEAAALIRDVAARKPVIAYTEGQMASAAYQLGAAAREIVAASTATLGSLGVVVTALDRTGAEARSGVLRHEFISSQTPNKRPSPGTDTGRAALQALADRTADEFLADVAFSRGTSVAALLEATGGGGMVIGRDAVASGLADRIAGFEETLSALASGDAPGDRRRGVVTPLQPKEAVLADTTETDRPADDRPATETTALPATQSVDAVTAERQRASQIQASVQPGYQALAVLATERGWTVQDFQIAQAAAIEGATAAAVSRPMTPASARLPPAATFAPPVTASNDGTAAPAPAPEGEAKWKAEWSASAALQAEFRTEAAYIAYKRASAAELVREYRRA